MARKKTMVKLDRKLIPKLAHLKYKHELRSYSKVIEKMLEGLKQ